METPVAVYYQKRPYKRTHSNNEDETCCLGNFTEKEREECLSDYPEEIVKQNQFILNLIYQFGDCQAKNEKQLEEINFKLLGRRICEQCLCVMYGLSDHRYQRIKNFYRMGAKVIYHGNSFIHQSKKETSFMAGAWLNSYLEYHSEPMPHADIYHLHAPTKQSVISENPSVRESLVSESLLYKMWDKKIKIPTKNQIFARCPQCQGLRKRCFEAGKCATAIEAIDEERRKHKELYMAEKQDYYSRQTKSVDRPDEVMCVIYDGMHKEKTKLPRFSQNPSKDLESIPRINCNLLGFICHRQGFNNYNKQGMAFLNFAYADNANFILSSLMHVIRTTDQQPFSRNLSCQFDNASNNKCNVAFGLFSYLVSEGIFYNVYGNTLLVNHTHEDVDRMFENANEQFRRSDIVIPSELSSLMKKVPYVREVMPVPCVWDISKFLMPFIRIIHDFGNVHHVWFHKSVEGNVVMHYKRYAKDRWLPDSDDPTTYIFEEDKCGILIFKEIPHGTPQLVEAKHLMTDEELEKVNSSVTRLFKHPLLQDVKLEERKSWWNSYLTGEALKAKETTWPVEELKERRHAQNLKNAKIARDITQGLAHSEEEMPMVYSGAYLDPGKREKQARENVALQNGQWPIKRVVKERINPRTHKKELLVDWQASWIAEENLSKEFVKTYEKKKKQKP